MPEGHEPEAREKPEEEPQETRPKPTMTDLSLAILTGEFSGSPPTKAASISEATHGFTESDAAFLTDADAEPGATPMVELPDPGPAPDQAAEGPFAFEAEERKPKKKKSSNGRMSAASSALAALIESDAENAGEMDDIEIIEDEDR